MSDDRGLFEESRLRAALRLDADEIPARLDSRLIAAAARSARPAPSDLLAPLAVAFTAGWLFAETSRAALAAAAAALGPEGLRLAIETVSTVARFVVPLGGAAWTALLPLVIAGAAAVVIAFDRRRTQHA
jgi:hypothetical protein